ncbi:hypothetical protein RDWZM_000258 [Blomia tropicalis]|uniref:Xenotropic and polytropic retrovirus receptor 1-like protein n=1 Tax=Blomia tropicalis TaxID=40697 RepID=A0A9Q0MAG7_BLOTA|nr:hypothetical protein RDWZM_000258 [Blomia tropicalis]
MKFAEHLSAHITPEWRKQYISYELMKEMLYAALEAIPNPSDQTINSQSPLEQLDQQAFFTDYVEEFDQQFLQFCEKELSKINTFFAEKLAEATRKFSDLKTELQSILPLPDRSNPIEFHIISSDGRTTNPISNNATPSRKASNTANTRKTIKKISDLKLAFSEFYLSLVLLQNYQELNFTGFRKILKKHDKLMSTGSGLAWRQKNVDGARFYTCKDVIQVIEETENLFTNVLEGGDRSRAMKRLRVPPLNAQQSLWTTFRVGLFSGAFIILFIAVILSMTFNTTYNHQINFSVMCRLFRAPFFVCLFTILIGLNIYGWRTSGVNHVLIFELNPRDHISEQHLFEIAFVFAVIWTLSILGYLYAPLLQMNANLFPLINIAVYVLFLCNPTRTFKHSARFWLIRVLGRVFAAPFFRVTFADFWLADQLNSLSILFSDFVYYICFYVNFYYNDDDLNSDSANRCLFNSRTYLIFRAISTALPAWFRFAQCLRRYRDDHNRSLFPHVVNAGKYSTTFFVVIFSTVTEITMEVKNDKISSPVFSLWILSLIISSIYTYAWDIKMDWGLMEVTNHSNDNLLLREEIVYSSSIYYYLAYIEDFVGRTLWAFTISLNQVGNINTDLLTTLAATFELFRRFIWNFFRLENEHLNNCGEFRAVRDISIAPIPHESPTNGGSNDGSNKSGSSKGKKKARLRRSIQYSINNASKS